MMSIIPMFYKQMSLKTSNFDIKSKVSQTKVHKK